MQKALNFFVNAMFLWYFIYEISKDLLRIRILQLPALCYGNRTRASKPT